MSRFLLACSLIGALTTSALAQSFAKPPTSSAPSAPSEVYEPDLRVAPTQVLDRAALRVKLIANRATNVANFRAYVKRGVFPSNTYKHGKLNVWIDAAGNMCAAATMINDWGLTSLVNRVGDQTNFIRLLDVRQGPLMDWMLTSGLTRAEIVAIQEPGSFVGQIVEPEAPSPILVDAKLRKAEDVRLTRRYKQVDAMIARNTNRSIEAAVDLLMKHPDLAWKLVNLES